MSILINHSFECLNHEVSVMLTEHHCEVLFDDVVIEDSTGDIVDWSDKYQNQWFNLRGAALKSAEIKFAREYAEATIGNWILEADQLLSD